MPERTIGVIGLGKIGIQFTDLLQKAGYPVVVRDVDDERVAAAVEIGGKAADSSGAVAQRADVILLSLPGNEYVEAVMEGDDGVLESLSEGQIVIDTGTTTPDLEVLYERACEERGAGYLEAPLTYGGPQTESEDDPPFAMFVGGKEEYYQNVKDIIDTLSKDHDRFGGIGIGQVTKAGHRIRQNCRAAVDAEVVEFYRNNGVDPEQMASFMQWDLYDRFFSEEYPEAHGFRSTLESEESDPDNRDGNSYRIDENRARPRLRQPSWMKDYVYALEIAISSNTATPVFSTVLQTLLGVQNYAEALSARELSWGEGLEDDGWEGRRDVITHYRRLNRPSEEWKRLYHAEKD